MWDSTVPKICKSMHGNPMKVEKKQANTFSWCYKPFVDHISFFVCLTNQESTSFADYFPRFFYETRESTEKWGGRKNITDNVCLLHKLAVKFSTLLIGLDLHQSDYFSTSWHHYQQSCSYPTEMALVFSRSWSLLPLWEMCWKVP